MPRTKLTVDPKQLEEQIAKLETERTFDNRSQLHNAIAETEWAKSNRITAAVVQNRIAEFAIQPKTPKGRVGGGNVQNRGARKSRSLPAVNLRALTQVVPPAFKGALNKLSKGSLTAAIRLKCLDCTDYQRAEIALCPIVACALHHVRPYKSNPSHGEDGTA